jgi:hypothetical protein
MFISHKNNVLQNINSTEKECRRESKNMSLSAYHTWVASITTQDSEGEDIITYPSEDFTIVDCEDEDEEEDVRARLIQLRNYSSPEPDGIIYNIKWSDSKVSAVIGQDPAGEDITIQTHFVGDDTARDARVLAEKWKVVRRDRDIRLAETDFYALSDVTLADNMKTYRQGLRDVPEDNADVDNINWPTKPE